MSRGVSAASVLLVLILVSQPLFAGEIYGRVEWSDGSPATGAEVVFRIEGASYTDSANRQGRYRLDPQKAGKGALSVMVDGDESTAVTVYSFDDSSRVDLELSREGGTLKLKRQ